MKQNILFIVIDSFRADKCFGKQKTSFTPNFEKLMKEGTYFSETVSCADGTILSLGGLFTGLFPFKVGLGGKSYNKLGKDIETYLSILKNAGYSIHGTVPKAMEFYNLTKDFDNKDDLTYDTFLRLKDGLDKKIHNKIKELENKKPWLYYIHLLDLHQPIWVPEHLDDEKFGDSKYERMISSIDEWIGKIAKKIDLQNTMIVITADHGEYLPFVKFGDKTISFEEIRLQKTQTALGNLFPSFLLPLKWKCTIWAHKLRTKSRKEKIEKLSLSSYEKRSLLLSRSDPDCYLYDELIKIPLFMIGSGFPKNKIIKNQIRSIDIFPTILEILKIKDKREIDGQSLVSLMNGNEFNELPAYAESSAFIKKSLGDVIGVRTNEYKYFRSIDSSIKKVHLYDLKKDPLEENNISSKEPDIKKKMESYISMIRKGEKIIQNEKMSKEERQNVEDELRKLGYI